MKRQYSGDNENKSPFKFSSEHFEENSFKEKDLVKLNPFGISMTADPHRPTLLLKDESGKHTLPVSLNPLEAGVTISQSAPNLKFFTPHRAMELLLDSLQIKIDRLVFVEIRNQTQFVRLYLSGHPTYGSIKLKAEEAMSLALHLKADLFATPEFMMKSKVMDAEVESMAQGLASFPELFQKPPGYLQ